MDGKLPTCFSIALIGTVSLWLSASSSNGARIDRESGSSSPLTPSDATTRPADPADWVRQLNHPIPNKRTAALRELAELGPMAIPPLRDAVDGPYLEGALLAERLLVELDSAVLMGADIHIRFNREQITWDEPVALVVDVRNPTEAPIRVPWPIALAASPDKQISDSALSPEPVVQVSAMLDISDYLRVVGPDGSPLELRVDPIERDALVAEAVNIRAGETPPSHHIPPGGAERLIVPAFNRGWARFPMLTAGQYVVQLVYQHDWSNSQWNEEAIGRIVTSAVGLTVTDSAPAELRHADKPLELRLHQQGSELIVTARNTYDRAQSINLNLSSAMKTHGRLHWRPVIGEAGDRHTIEMAEDTTDPVFDINRVYTLEPLEEKVISRLPVVTLLRSARSLGARSPVTVSVRYSQLSTPPEIREILAGIDIADELPSNLFTGTASSNAIEVGD